MYNRNAVDNTNSIYYLDYIKSMNWYKKNFIDTLDKNSDIIGQIKDNPYSYLMLNHYRNIYILYNKTPVDATNFIFLIKKGEFVINPVFIVYNYLAEHKEMNQKHFRELLNIKKLSTIEKNYQFKIELIYHNINIQKQKKIIISL
jgi:hypothetical protein